MKEKKDKPFVIIRRSGYYINAIVNDKDAIRNWKANNIPLRTLSVENNEDEIQRRHTINQAVHEQYISFMPATARQVESAPCYLASFKYKYGNVTK